MRILSYVLTFCAVTLTLLMNVLSIRSPNWLVVRYQEVLNTRVTVSYGLTQRCELTITRIPGPSTNGRFEYKDYTCRDFPTSVSDGCDDENKPFCIAWESAGYIAQLAVGVSALSLLTILFGVTTHSLRRRIWKVVAGLVFLQVILQTTTFGIITELYNDVQYPTFERARPGIAYAVHTASWVLGVIVACVVVTAGISANRGHRWAAGNRAYQPIPGGS